MKYEDVVKKVKANLKKADAGKVGEHVAVQFDITGEGEGAFYVEVKDGAIEVEPYEYKENDIKVTASADDILLITSGKISYTELLSDGRAYGDGIIFPSAFFVKRHGIVPVKKCDHGFDPRRTDLIHKIRIKLQSLFVDLSRTARDDPGPAHGKTVAL